MAKVIGLVNNTGPIPGNKPNQAPLYRVDIEGISALVPTEVSPDILPGKGQMVEMLTRVQWRSGQRPIIWYAGHSVVKS